MLPATEIDTGLVQWARANLPKIPENEGIFYDQKISGMLVKPGPKSMEYETRMKQKCNEYDRIDLNHFPTIEDFFKARMQYAKTHLLGQTKEKVMLERPFRLNFGYNISVGENFYANFGCTMLDWSVIKIGDNVALGPNCTLTCVNHPLDGDHRLSNLGLYAFPIVIEDNVWVGANAVILSGVHIGEGAVIGAGSVVTKSVPAHTIVVGNPARIIGKSKGRSMPEPVVGP